MITIEQGDSSPYVKLNPDNYSLVIRGNSFVSNPGQFYKEVMDWGKSLHLPAGAQLKVEISMGYYSTSNIQLLNLLFKTIISNNHKNAVDVLFFVSREDEEDLEETMLSLIFNTGIELKKQLV